MLIRVETYDGTVAWRNPPDLEHSTLCKSFHLDPVSTWFDLPSTARGVGSASGAQARGKRIINGYIFQGPKGSDPIGTITIVRQDERIPDVDPTDRSDFFRLSGR